MVSYRPQPVRASGELTAAGLAASHHQYNASCRMYPGPGLGRLCTPVGIICNGTNEVLAFLGRLHWGLIFDRNTYPAVGWFCCGNDIRLYLDIATGASYINPVILTRETAPLSRKVCAPSHTTV